MVKTLLGCVREFKRASILTPLFVSGEVVLECIIPLIMARLIDEMTGESLAPIYKYGLILVVLAFASLLCGVLSGRYAATASTGFAKNLRQDLFFKVQEFDFADIDMFSTSSLVTRMTTDVTNVQNAYQMIIRIAVRTPLMLVFSIIMSLSVSVRMSVIFLCILPVLGIFLFGVARTVFPIFQRIFKKYDALNNSVQENVAGIRVVKAFVREDYEKEKFRASSEEVRADFTYAERILALNSPVMMFCIYMAMLLVSYFGARMIIASGATELTTGELSTLTSYGVQILASMMMLSMVFVMMSMASESAQRIVEVLNHESLLSSPPEGKRTVDNGSVRFENVSFRYRADSDKAALSDIDLDIPSGATVGILGGGGFAEFDGFASCCELQKLYLDDSVKGRGLGSRLLAFLEKRAGALGYRRIYLETHHVLNAALHLYEKRGYAEIGRPEGVVHSTMDRFYLKQL